MKDIVKKDQTLTFNLDALDEIREESGAFVMQPTAESFLRRWLEFKKVVEETDEQIKKRFIALMTPQNVKKIEGEEVSVSRRYYGSRYELTDPQLARDLGFGIEEVRVKPDSKAIDAYVKDTGDLPDGVSLRERTESVTISTVKHE